ncbi:NAD(P)H-dependent oxidoreductase [Persicobacter diffluens]|uniref:NAD(P)H dehydrogenase n=1 Tax=Persicobacter diffluens TaxID=981 RepID=A0AAN4W1C8_9BACT|nr:NAD(P)H dehydrogenase [Persicobacter diffluens]
MKHLVIIAHPNPTSLSFAYVDQIVKTTEENGHEVEVRNLYDIGFKATLDATDFGAFQQGESPEDIAKEQQWIKWADTISFVYPIWWTGMPAILKGYFDRVFAYGFAYSVNEDGSYNQHLSDKKVLVFNNHGAPAEYYDSAGFHDAFLKTSDEGIFNFTGMEVLKHHFFGNVINGSDELRKGYIATVKDTIERFFPATVEA